MNNEKLKKDFKTVRRYSAMSLIELLVAVIIIGIASAGTMELAYVNAYWAANGLNKADNLHVARRFLDTVGLDIRSAVSLDTNSFGSQLTLFRTPELGLQGSNYYDANGFPSTNSKVIYKVIPDPSAIDSASPEYVIQRQQDNGAPVTVLTSLVGPFDSIGNLAVFEYILFNNPTGSHDGTSSTLSASPAGHVLSPAAVDVNLELKKHDFGGSTQAMNSSTNHSFEAMRAEIFLRNSQRGFVQ